MKCDVEKIWKQNEKKTFGFIRKRVRDNELSKEILQVVMLKVFNYCEKRSDVRNIPSWIFQIAYNTIVDYYKSNSNFISLPEDIIDISFNHEENNAANWVGYFINRIPKKYSEPLLLSDLKGVNQKSIADYLGLSLPAIKSRIQRGRKLLRKSFDECGIIELSEHGQIGFTPVKSCCKNLYP